MEILFPIPIVKVEEQDYLELQKRVQELKMQELFEEPSTYEDENEDDYFLN